MQTHTDVNKSGANGDDTMAETRQAITDSVRLLVEPGSVFEARLLNTSKGIVSGYFDDPARAALALLLWDGKAEGSYLTLNPVNPELLARAENRLKPYAKHTTDDSNILSRRWLLLDHDPVRPSGISSTDTEHNAALARAWDCRSWLHILGISTTVGDSGNGGHNLVRIDLPHTADSTALIKRCLEAVAFRFDDDAVKVDVSVNNPARISKIYGTLVQKGDATADRPHRRARLLEVADDLTPVSRELLERLAALAPEEPHTERKQHKNGSYSFALDEWITSHALDLHGPYPWNTGRKWIFPVCPWNPEHTNRAAFLLQFASGAVAAGCHHNGCQGNDWHALRDTVEPGWQAKKNSANGHAGMHGPPPPPEPEPEWSGFETDGRESQESHPQHEEFKARVRCAAEIAPEDVSYLWYPYFPLGKLGILGGDSGVGKSYLTSAIATSFSLGRWPFFLNGKESIRESGNTLIFSAEDGVADTYIPRLINLGADLTRIHFVDGKEDWKGNLHRVVLNDKAVIMRTIQDYHAQFVVFDPLQSFLPRGTKMNDMETVRPVLDALIEAATMTRAFILLAGHLSKARQDTASYKFLGSVDWFNAARTAILAVKNPDKPETERLFYHVKNSLGPTAPGMGFSIAADNEPLFLWGKTVDVSIEDVFSGNAKQGHKEEDAKEFLKGELAEGVQTVEYLREAAKKVRIAWRTIERAKSQLKIRAHKDGFQGPWVWELPGAK